MQVRERKKEREKGGGKRKASGRERTSKVQVRLEGSQICPGAVRPAGRGTDFEPVPLV